MKIIRSAVRIILIAGISGCLVTGCKKKEIQGPKGEAGTPGGGGNTTISNSSVFTIFPSQWHPNPDSSAWQANISSALLTQDVVDKGAVKVYVLRESAWWELPNNTDDFFMQLGFGIGVVQLTFSDIHGGLPPKPVITDYRLVTISESGRFASPYANTGSFTDAKQMKPCKQ